MGLHEEKRSYQRYERRRSMNLYRMDHQDQCYYAEMNDYSQGGLSMMTNERLVIGHLVYLEMKNYDESATGLEKYESYRGSVKWIIPCTSDRGHDKASYKYGVEYSESARPKFH